MIREVHVVVPARDEERRLGACLRSVHDAVAVLRERMPHVHADVLVVLDRCTDGSTAIARAAGVRTLALGAGSVGVARRTGVAAATRDAAVPGAEVWVACTDADTTVGPDWLVAQLAAADAGADLVIGSVRPDPTELSPTALAQWSARHRIGGGPGGEPGVENGVENGDEHGAGTHVHGANLGFRLSAYDLVGGFPPVPEHEDVRLVEAMREAGLDWASGPTVTTSGRRTGRTPGGFAGYLRALHLPADAESS